jgi:ABC-type lipoprotein export system ATPase subunit
MFEMRDLQHAYNGVEALRVPAFGAAQGEHWLVLGASGSGKSTLLHILAGLLQPTRGEVVVAGQRLNDLSPARLDRFRGQHVGIVLQQLHLIPTLSVEKNVLLAQYLSGAGQDRSRVQEVLASLDLSDRTHAYPHELSHGQAQRVAVARAVVNKPRLLVADEPTSNLDDERCMQALELLRAQARVHAATLVIATHDRRITTRIDNQFRLDVLRPGSGQAA